MALLISNRIIAALGLLTLTACAGGSSSSSAPATVVAHIAAECPSSIEGKYLPQKSDVTLTIAISRNTSGHLYVKYTGQKTQFDFTVDGKKVVPPDARAGQYLLGYCSGSAIYNEIGNEPDGAAVMRLTKVGDVLRVEIRVDGKSSTVEFKKSRSQLDRYEFAKVETD